MKNSRSVVVAIENDAATLKAIERLLRASGYVAEGFASAEKFLERRSDAEIACLLLDIDLDGMSGIELQRKLVAAGQAPPIIFITASADDVCRTQAMELGCIAYLKKPFEAQSLMQSLARAELV